MGAKILSDAGAAALADVTRLDAERRAALARAEADAQRLIERRTADLNARLGEAVHRALAEGVPHTRVGRDGMSTRDWNMVERFAAIGAEQVA